MFNFCIYASHSRSGETVGFDWCAVYQSKIVGHLCIFCVGGMEGGNASGRSTNPDHQSMYAPIKADGFARARMRSVDEKVEHALNENVFKKKASCLTYFHELLIDETARF